MPRGSYERYFFFYLLVFLLSLFGKQGFRSIIAAATVLCEGLFKNQTDTERMRSKGKSQRVKYEQVTPPVRAHQTKNAPVSNKFSFVCSTTKKESFAPNTRHRSDPEPTNPHGPVRPTRTCATHTDLCICSGCPSGHCALDSAAASSGRGDAPRARATTAVRTRSRSANPAKYVDDTLFPLSGERRFAIIKAERETKTVANLEGVFLHAHDTLENLGMMS